MIGRLFNPQTHWKAWQFRRIQRGYDRSAYDLELWLYGKILRNDMLHYGYFNPIPDVPDSISLADLEQAQAVYAQLLLEQMSTGTVSVLDAGCGLGGLTALLLARGKSVTALTPNEHQAGYVSQKYPDVTVVPFKYENWTEEAQFDAVIHSESLQYIPLEAAFNETVRRLTPGGRWIISDYFRIRDDAHASGHRLRDFRKAAESRGWRITAESDITKHVLPTLQLIRLYADRFLMPLRHFGEEKLRYKRPYWYFMTAPWRKKLSGKIDREMQAIDPDRFSKEKQYMLFTLERP